MSSVLYINRAAPCPARKGAGRPGRPLRQSRCHRL